MHRPRRCVLIVANGHQDSGVQVFRWFLRNVARGGDRIVIFHMSSVDFEGARQMGHSQNMLQIMICNMRQEQGIIKHTFNEVRQNEQAPYELEFQFVEKGDLIDGIRETIRQFSATVIVMADNIHVDTPVCVSGSQVTYIIKRLNQTIGISLTLVHPCGEDLTEFPNVTSLLPGYDNE